MSSVLICRRCQRTNPASATFCYFDGENLRGQANGSVGQLPQAFVFPSGRRCQTFDELGQACQDEWADARTLLHDGTFARYFGAAGRADLSRAAEQAKAQANPDIGLSEFIGALPGVRHQVPKLDLNPRRLLVGTLLAGETKQVQLTVSNQGQGLLQGTITVTEGQDWLSLADGKTTHELPIAAPRQQVVTLTIATKGVAAGQTYGAKLTVVTNGGVVEVPLRMDVAPRPFDKAPFQGVRTQRELAERMRPQPKAAVPLLESGEVARWFADNGWTWPITGPDVKGVAAVQQFFEALGLAKPPALQLTPAEVSLVCRYPAGADGQVTLKTPSRKWVYAQVTSDVPWLKVKTPQVSGGQQATVAFEIDPQAWTDGPTAEGKLLLIANGAQKLSARVAVEMRNLPTRRRAPTPPPPSPAAPMALPASAASPSITLTPAGLVPTVVTITLALLLLRLLLVPLIDVTGRGGATAVAAEKLHVPEADSSPAGAVGGWLRLPWPSILLGSSSGIPADLFRTGASGTVPAAEFRHYFVNTLARHVMLLTWWLGAVFGALVVWRRGHTALDLMWGAVAGAFAGLMLSATLACVILVLDFLPHLLWSAIGSPGGWALVPVWSLVAVICWTVQGVALGLAAYLLPPLRLVFAVPLLRGTARLFRRVGLARLAETWG